MNETVSNYLRWAIVVGFLLIPPFLVRSVVNIAPEIRIVSQCLLVVVITAIGLYLTFRRGDIVAGMPIAKDLKTDRSRTIAALFFRGLALLVAMTGAFMSVNIAPSLLLYEVAHKTPRTEVHVINQINSPAVPGAFYMYVSILTDDKHYLSFWYPDKILQVGHKYAFTILPNSDFVLEAKELN